jgi:hypothetical protein
VVPDEDQSCRNNHHQRLNHDYQNEHSDEFPIAYCTRAWHPIEHRSLTNNSSLTSDWTSIPDKQLELDIRLNIDPWQTTRAWHPIEHRFLTNNSHKSCRNERRSATTLRYIMNRTPRPLWVVMFTRQIS